MDHKNNSKYAKKYLIYNKKIESVICALFISNLEAYNQNKEVQIYEGEKIEYVYEKIIKGSTDFGFGEIAK